MSRTTGRDEESSRAKKGDRGRGPRSTQSRTTLISKACSKLLRHQAVNEGIPITSDGWVRLDHLLGWKGLSGRNGVSPPPTVEEIFGVVEDNEKKRFAVRLVEKNKASVTEKEEALRGIGVQDQPSTTVGDLMQAAEGDDSSPIAKSILSQATSAPQQVIEKAKGPGALAPQPAIDTIEREAQVPNSSDAIADSETAQAITHYRTTKPSPPASAFQVRAVQGHSIQAVASDTSLLTPITLDDPSSIPDTCVHGTFYGAWPLILQSGGLKRMGRNHVHFASGPSLIDIGVTEEGEVTKEKEDKVISGMRHDAQLLIYIDLRRCLEDIRAEGGEMLWYRSENGVILTEGVEERTSGSQAGTDGVAQATPKESDDQQTAEKSSEYGEERLASEAIAATHVNRNGHGGRFRTQASKNAQAAGQSNKLVPMKYWKVVVDIKGGQGVIWRQGDGVVKDLSEASKAKGNPKNSRGRGGGGRGRGR